MKKALLAGAATVLVAFPVLAQNTAGFSSEGSGLGDIVVTATRRSESAIAVPISITALDQSSLDRQSIRDIGDITRIAPSVRLSGGSVSIRGISTLAGASTTGIYIDDTPIQTRVPIQGGTSTVFPLIFDLERVEVLRGPQGTLFGAGSQGGTLRFITPSPSLDRTSMYSRAEVNFTEHGTPSFEAGVALGQPIIEGKIGIRASVWTRHQGGYVDRVSFIDQRTYGDNVNDNNAVVARVAAVVAPTEQLRITPSVYYQSIDQKDSGTIWRDAGDYKSWTEIPQPNFDRFVLPALSIDYDFPGFSFKSITSRFIRDTDGTNRFYHSFAQGCPPGGQAPGYPEDKCGLIYPQIPDYYLADHQKVTQRNWAQEFRLTSTGDGPFSWVVGLFYQNNKQTYYEDEDEPRVGELTQLLFGMSLYDYAGVGMDLIDGRYAFIEKSLYQDKEYAAYGDFTYEIVPKLKATVGLRYSKTSFNFSDFSDGPFGASSRGPVVTGGSSSEKPFTPKFSIAYDLAPGTLYFTAAKGYRMGGANGVLPNFCAPQLAELGISGAPPPYKSDSVWSYELGAKKQFANRLEVAGSAYQIDWTGIQGSIPLNSCSYAYTSNFGKARVRGFDLQIQANLTDGLQIGGSLAYNDGEYKQTIPQPNSTTLLAENGAPMVNSPKWQGTASAQYDFTVKGGVDGYVRADYHYTGKYFRNNPPGVIGYLASSRNGAAVDEVSLRGGATFGDFDLSVFVNNLFDNKTPLTQTYSTRLGTYGSRAERYTILRPRTIGVTGVYRY